MSLSEGLTVLKVGTGVLTRVEDGTLDRAAMLHLVAEIAALMQGGRRCVLVSSGAVGSGVSAMGLDGYPSDTATRQACAAVGQARLMQNYSVLFGHFEITVAQVLLTAGDLATEGRAKCVSDTLRRLLVEGSILPIINENDSVAVEELKFGDNDLLSSRVARLVGAEHLVLLSTVDGLLRPGSGEVVREVARVEDVRGLVTEERGRFSMGGMASKLAAVELATSGGIETYIAHGRKPSRLGGILRGDEGAICTHFFAQREGVEG